MSIVEILYIISGACIVVVTVTIVWLANETIKLVKSLRKSSDDVALMTSEMKEKVLVVTEALDRAGTAATNIIGFIEDAIDGIKEKRDQLSQSIGLVAGVGDFFKKRKESEKEDEEHIRRVEKEAEVEDEKAEEFVEELKSSKAKNEDLEHAKPIKKEKAEKPEVKAEEEEDEARKSNDKSDKKK